MKNIIEKLDAIEAGVDTLNEEVVKTLENVVYEAVGTFTVKGKTNEQIDEEVEAMLAGFWKN